MKHLWKRTLHRLPNLLRFIPIYFREMTLSNLRVAADALRLHPRFKPGFVEISVANYDPIQRWEAACLISMTPGTLTLDLEDGSDQMIVHCLYLEDAEQTRRELTSLIHQALGNPTPTSS